MSKLFKETTHSDILVYWTGKDIDPADDDLDIQFLESAHNDLIKNQNEIKCRIKNEGDFRSLNKKIIKPTERPSLIKQPKIILEYFNRLKDILRYGLWLTSDDNDFIGKAPNKIHLPSIPRACFTELKLSEARKHAFRYGRLGIGVKRMFLVKAGGRPLNYIHESSPKAIIDKINALNGQEKIFYKNMSSEGDMNYDYYSESEWRLIYRDEFKSSFIDPKDQNNVELHTFYNKLQNEEKKTPNYLIPLNFWFAVIIYPCPAVKILAEQDREIRQLIINTRSKGLDQYLNLLQQEEYHKQIKLKQLAELSVGESYMMPMEIDLDTISHF